MQAANEVVRDRAPGGEVFIAVGGGCMVAEVARDFHLPSLAVALGASMFQRAVTSDVKKSTLKCDLELERTVLPMGAIRFCHADGRFEAQWRDESDTWPLLVYLVCLNLALKSLHYPRAAPRKLGGYCSMHGIVRQVCTRRPLVDVWTTWKSIRPMGAHRPSGFEDVEAWVMRRIRFNLGLRPMPSSDSPSSSSPRSLACSSHEASSTLSSPSTVIVDSTHPRRTLKRPFAV